MISSLYVELVVSHVILRITCKKEVRIKLWKWKPTACAFFRTHITSISDVRLEEL